MLYNSIIYYTIQSYAIQFNYILYNSLYISYNKYFIYVSFEKSNVFIIVT